MNLYRETFLNISKFPRTFWWVILATFINQIGNMAIVFLMLYATQHLKLSISQGAVAFAVVSAMMFFSGLFSGNVIDRIGAAKITIIAVVINGLILFTFPFIKSYHTLLFCCLLWGTSFGTYRSASQTLVSFFSTGDLHKITFAVFRLAINLGMSIGPAIGGYLATHSFQDIFIFNGVANLLAGMILLILLINGSIQFSQHTHLEKKVFSLKLLKHDSALRFFVIAMIPISMVFFQHESTLAVYMKEDLGLPISLYGWLFTINTLIIVCFELVLNVATLNWPYRVNFILGTIFIAAGFAGVVFATTGLHIILVTIIWTIGEMILFPSTSSYIAEIAPEGQRGSYMSLYNAAGNLGMFIGPWTGAIVMQHLGGATLWSLCAVMGVISIIFFSFLQQPARDSLPK
jgi:MFS family permease